MAPNTIDDLPEDVRTSFLAGYTTSDRQVCDLLRSGIDEEKVKYPHPQAFVDGCRLNNVLYFMSFADSCDYDSDQREYAALANELNERYGDFVIRIGEQLSPSETASLPWELGPRGHTAS